MGDWQVKRDDLGTGRGNSDAKWQKYLNDRKGKNLFDLMLAVGVFDPDFSNVQPARNFGNLWLWSFGARKGSELENYGEWTKGSVETIVSIIKKEKAPRQITMLWENDGRSLFSAFKGKKLNYEIAINVHTPGSLDVAHFILTLDECHITSVSPEFHKIDKKSTKFLRINSTCSGNVELKTTS